MLEWQHHVIFQRIWWLKSLFSGQTWQKNLQDLVAILSQLDDVHIHWERPIGPPMPHCACKKKDEIPMNVSWLYQMFQFFFKSHCTDVGWTVANKLWHCSPWVCLEIGHTPQCLRCVHHFQAHFIPGWSSHKTSHSVSNSIFGPIWVNFITTSVE